MSKRLIVLSICLLAAVAGLVFVYLRPTPERQERQWSAWSRERLEREAERRPGDARLQFALARKRMEAGDGASAETALEAALRSDPKFARARATLGTLLLNRDEDPQAVLQLKQAVRDDPACADGYLGLALLYQRNEAWALEEQAADLATRLEPENNAAWLLKGEAASRQGDHQKAVGCYEKAAALRPTEANPLTLAAQEQLALGDFAKAEALARKAIALQPKFPRASTVLGQTLMRLGKARYPEAEKALANAAAFGDDTGRAHLELARVQALQGRPAEAEQQFRLAARDNPSMSEAYYGLSQSLRVQGKTQDAGAAESEFRRWVQFKERAAKLHDQLLVSPDDSARWFALARLYAGMQLWSDARRYALAGLRRAPTDEAGAKLLKLVESHAG
jgi:tetratricopeptide (TPR) repeat protein